MDLSNQLVALHDMNPFVRLERMVTPPTRSSSTRPRAGPMSKTRSSTLKRPSTKTMSPSSSKDNSVQLKDENRCLICWTSFCPMENRLIKSHFKAHVNEIVESMSKLLLGVDEERAKMWKCDLLKKPDLPLCKICFQTIHQLWGLQSQMELMKEEISLIVKRIKGAIWLSYNTYNISDVEDIRNKFRTAAINVCQPSQTKAPAPVVATTHAKSLRSQSIKDKFPTLALPITPRFRRRPSKCRPKRSGIKKKKPIKPARQSPVTKKTLQILKSSRPCPANKTKVKTQSNKNPRPELESDVGALSETIRVKLEDYNEDEPSYYANDCDDGFENMDNVDSSFNTNEKLVVDDSSDPVSSVLLKSPNFENSECVDCAEPETKVKKKRRKNFDLLMNPDEMGNVDLFLTSKTPRKCAEAAKKSLAMVFNDDSSDNDINNAKITDLDAEFLKSSTCNSDPDSDFRNGTQEVVIQPKNTQKRKRIRKRRKIVKPNADKQERTTILPSILKRLELETMTEFEYKGFKAIKLPSGLWQCQCGDIYQETCRAKQHINSTHIEGEHKCKFCELVFGFKSELVKHSSEVHTGERIFPCPVENCNKTYENRGSLHWHRTWVHNKKTRAGPRKCVYCTVCSKPCINAGKLVIHMRQHTGERPIICEICSHACSSSNALINHKKTIHENPSYSRKPCKKLIPDKAFKCNMCERLFLTKYKLQAHIRVHISQRLYNCKYCNHSFNSTYLKTRHEIERHPEHDQDATNNLSEIKRKELEIIRKDWERKKKLWKKLPPRGKINPTLAASLIKEVETPTEEGENSQLIPHHQSITDSESMSNNVPAPSNSTFAISSAGNTEFGNCQTATTAYSLCNTESSFISFAQQVPSNQSHDLLDSSGQYMQLMPNPQN